MVQTPNQIWNLEEKFQVAVSDEGTEENADAGAFGSAASARRRSSNARLSRLRHRAVTRWKDDPRV